MVSLENFINSCHPFLQRIVFDYVGVKQEEAEANFGHLSWLGASRGDSCVIDVDLAGYGENLVMQEN